MYELGSSIIYQKVSKNILQSRKFCLIKKYPVNDVIVDIFCMNQVVQLVVMKLKLHMKSLTVGRIDSKSCWDVKVNQAKKHIEHGIQLLR